MRIKISVQKDTIETAQITGDFFLHPEDAIELLEKTVAGNPASISHIELKQKLDETITKNNLMLVGFSSDDIARMTTQVLQVQK